jgi:hypothetical protein
MVLEHARILSLPNSGTFLTPRCCSRMHGSTVERHGKCKRPDQECHLERKARIEPSVAANDVRFITGVRISVFRGGAWHQRLRRLWAATEWWPAPPHARGFGNQRQT